MYDQHIILDFEMNPVACRNLEHGSSLKREIIEIGAVKLNSNYEVIDKFSCLIKPEHNRNIIDHITKLTGIHTSDVCNAMSFAEALLKFDSWIGPGKNRVYSWSDSDLKQIEVECACKNVRFPHNITRWMDFQALFPRIMGLNHDVQMSLYDAANWYGTEMDSSSAHRALYDAEITARLTQGVLTGEYKAVSEKIHKYYKPHKQTREECTGSCLGELFGDVFHNFATKIQTDFSR